MNEYSLFIIENTPLLKNFLFITKQGFFTFLDKLSKVIEVKKVLTNLILYFLKSLGLKNIKKLNVLKNWDKENRQELSFRIQ